MTLNLPLNIGPGPFIPSSLAPLPVPSFLGFNATFNYIPEIKWLLTALSMPEIDLTPINSHIL
jgi:hypothetical protein